MRKANIYGYICLLTHQGTWQVYRKKPLIMATFMFVSDGNFWGIDTGIDLRKGVKGKEYSLPMVLCILRTIWKYSLLKSSPSYLLTSVPFFSLNDHKCWDGVLHGATCSAGGLLVPLPLPSCMCSLSHAVSLK